MEMGVKPGPRMGELLTQIEDAQLEGRLDSREGALVLAKELASTEGGDGLNP